MKFPHGKMERAGKKWRRTVRGDTHVRGQLGTRNRGAGRIFRKRGPEKLMSAAGLHMARPSTRARTARRGLARLQRLQAAREASKACVFALRRTQTAVCVKRCAVISLSRRERYLEWSGQVDPL